MQFDLVFEGGGAKGSAFAGATQTFIKRGCTFRRLIGTSAGAITAVLMAAGYGPDEMLAAVNEKGPDGQTPRFASFMDAPATNSFSDAVIDDSFSMRTMGRVNLPLGLGGVALGLKRGIVEQLLEVRGYRHLFSLIERGGVYSGETFRLWLREKLHAKGLAGLTLQDFEQATGVDVSFAITDTTSGDLRVLNHRTAPDCPVEWAVRMSMSIPLVWQEVVWEPSWGTYLGTDIAGHTIVDGGVLSNFPLDLLTSTDPHVLEIMGDDIVQDAVPNLGFLIDETLEVPGAPSADGNAADHVAGETAEERQARFKLLHRIKRLMDTMMGANNQLVIQQHEDQICRLPAKGYGTTEFDMSAERLKALVDEAAHRTDVYLDEQGAF